MRIREIGPVSVQTSADMIQLPENTVLGNYSFDCLQRSEVMEDVQHPPPPCGFKPCSHRKVNLAWNNSTQFPLNHYVQLGSEEQHSFLYPAAFVYEYFDLSQHVLDTHCSEAEFSRDDLWQLAISWDRLKPQLKPELDLAVFLAEIRELPELAIDLYKRFDFLRRFWNKEEGITEILDGVRWFLKRRQKKSNRGIVRVTLDEAGNSLADEWLGYFFALKPTVDELLGILRALISTKKKVEDLISGAGKLHKVHSGFEYHEDLEPQVIEAMNCSYCSGGCRFSETDGSYENARGWRCREVYSDMENTCGITVFYRYSLPDWVESFPGKVNALLSNLGLSPGLDTIWELIPFSFVVDWLIPVGDVLAKLQLDPFPVKTEVLDICFSKRQKYKTVLQGRIGCNIMPDVVYANVEVEKYRRIVGQELLYQIPTFRWPKWLQLSLGAALLKKLWPRRKR